MKLTGNDSLKSTYPNHQSNPPPISQSNHLQSIQISCNPSNNNSRNNQFFFSKNPKIQMKKKNHRLKRNGPEIHSSTPGQDIVDAISSHSWIWPSISQEMGQQLPITTPPTLSLSLSLTSWASKYQTEQKPISKNKSIARISPVFMSPKMSVSIDEEMRANQLCFGYCLLIWLRESIQ